MSLVVVGSIGLDTVKTPFGQVREVLGGSSVYFSIAASYFTDVKLVAVVGEDFPSEHIDLLKSRKIDVEGLARAKGQTFRWTGEYGFDLNEAKTLETHLNVFETFDPKLPASYCNSDYLFLANIDPVLQSKVQKQVKKPLMVACDTMNFWIGGKRNELLETLKGVDTFIINDGEAREFGCESNLVKAAKQILSYGPKNLIIKRGEYGVIMFNNKNVFAAPAYPLENVFDPTGAGDSFAGGFMGYLAKTGDLTEENFRQAIIFGSVMASFNVEEFSLNKLKSLNEKMITERYMEFKKLTHFEAI